MVHRARCASCGVHAVVDERGRCNRCVLDAVNRAAALDALDLAVFLATDAGLNRAQINAAVGFALAGRAGTLPGDDFLERRPDDHGDLVWDVHSTFVRDEPTRRRAGRSKKEGPTRSASQHHPPLGRPVCSISPCDVPIACCGVVPLGRSAGGSEPGTSSAISRALASEQREHAPPDEMFGRRPARFRSARKIGATAFAAATPAPSTAALSGRSARSLGVPPVVRPSPLRPRRRLGRL